MLENTYPRVVGLRAGATAVCCSAIYVKPYMKAMDEAEQAKALATAGQAAATSAAEAKDLPPR